MSGPQQPSSSSTNGSRASSQPSSSSSFLPTKSSSNAGTRSSSSLSSKFGRFVGNVLSSPSSSSSSAAPASAAEGAGGGGGSSSERATRRHSGWVDLVPSGDSSPPTRDQDRNPFLVLNGESSTFASNAGRARAGSRAGEPSTSTQVAGPSSSSDSSFIVSSSSVPPTPVRQHSYTSQRTNTPPSISRRQSSSFGSANGADQQVVVSSSSPSLRSTWTRKTRPRANTGGSTSSTSTPKWSWTAISSGSLAKGFGSNPTGTGMGSLSKTAKEREPIDSGWGEPDELVRGGDGERAAGSFEDEGYWEGEQAKQGFDIICSLPTEIALYIYLFLPRPSLAVCARVSRTWNELAADSSIWRAYFVSNPSWHLRPSYLRSRLPPPSPTKELAALSLHSPTLTPTPPRRPASANRTPSSISKTASYLAPDTSVPEGVEVGASGIPWKKVCEKRVWLDRRWGDEKVGGEMKLEGHDDSVYCLQFDRKKIVTGSRDQNIKVWSLDTGECLQTVHAHDASVLCLMFEPETGFMVSGGSDAKIIVWDLGGPGIQQKPLTKKHILGGHRQGVLDIAINKDYIVSCSKDTNLLIHSRSNLEHLHTLTGHTGPVNAIGICGGRVASASGDGKIKIWDIVSGECVRTMEGHERGLACVDFKEDYIVSGSNDRTMKVWSASTGECLRTLTGHTDLVRTLAMDPESGRIVSGGYDKQILIWSLFTGEIVQTLKSSHTSLVFDIKFDAGKIVSASHDKLVIVHDFGDDESARMFA